MTDREILARAIKASGSSARGFARDVLGVDERTVRRWLAGERDLQETARRVCRLILARPALADELRAAGD